MFRTLLPLTMLFLSPLSLNAMSPETAFMKTLLQLCGERFEGVMTYPQDDEHDFANKVLVATFENCSSTTTRVPFTVGEDKSRTWVFSKTTTGIELKHDHRHADGSPDDVTNYGGVTLSVGTGHAQTFPADKYTQNLIPDAATNVWNVSFNLDASELTYHLERHDAPRFTAVLKRVSNDKD